MSLKGALAFTLADWAKRIDPDSGKISRIVELLEQTNEILDDALWVEGNLPTGHRTTVRTDVPEPTWRKLNYGVKPAKSKTKQVDDACGMLEAYAEVDKALADLNGNTAEFRLSEDRAHIEGMNQSMARTLFYGDTAVNPERFLGLSPRLPFSDLPNVIDAGGGGECTSVWLVVWGENTVHMTFPKGSRAGLQHTDKGQVTLQDDAGGLYEGYRAHYKWEAGLVVRDWRYVVRICNIETAGDGAPMKPEYLIKAINAVPNIKMGKPAIYCNRTVKTQFDIAAMNKANASFTFDDVFGRPVTRFWGIPIRQCDAIANNESALALRN